MESVYLSATNEQRRNYKNFLTMFASLSRLYSVSEKPYLDYRIAEMCFIRAFEAKDYTRSCLAIDVMVGDVGVGIKTFVDVPYQKIAEIDRESGDLNGDAAHDARAVSLVRNCRMEAARDICGVKEFIYHYTVRKKGEISVYEEPMRQIDVDSIRVTKKSDKSFDFTDGVCKYRYSRSKNTLYKEFEIEGPIATVGVSLIDDPLGFLETAFESQDLLEAAVAPAPYIVLPLFSMKGGRNVPEKSGLNQWNAKGRTRNPNEVYVALPAKAKRMFPNFFPERGTKFRLVLPDGKELSAMVCQDEGKAIMTDPNSDLGEWLLRTVLKMPEKQIVTIDILDRLMIDAVVFHKYEDYYTIGFAYIGKIVKEEGYDFETIQRSYSTEL